MTRLYLSTNSANAANVSVFTNTNQGPALANGDIVIQGTQPNVLDLANGEYVVRADWANGAVSTHYVTIGPDEVRLDLDNETDRRRSPSSTAQTEERYVANVSNPTDFLIDVARASSRGYRGSDALSSIDWSSTVQRTNVRDLPVSFPIESRTTTCEIRAFIWEKPTRNWRPISHDDASDMLTPDGNHETEDVFSFWVEPGERFLFEIKKAEAPTRVVAFPGFAQPHRFYLSLRNASGAPRVLPSISARVNDPTLQALLDILANPGAPNAQGLLDSTALHDGSAQGYLRAKTKDPFAAAVGGYLLIRHRRLDLLHNWPNNLAEWFPDLPDAAIIAGWQALLQSSDSDSHRAASHAIGFFAAALSRGSPIFDEGLSLLDTGLKFVTRLVDKSEEDLCLGLRRKLQPMLDNRAAFGAFFGFIGEAPHSPGAAETETAPATFTVHLKPSP